jgi:uncharacterized membrane protein YfcA
VTTIGYVIALGTVAVGALTQGALGFGFGMLAAPVLAIVDDDLVPGAVLVLGVTVAAIIAWQERGALDWRGIRWALVGRVLGTVLGVLALSWLDAEDFAIVLGSFILVAVVLSVAGWHVRPTRSTLVGAGTVSGVMGTLTSIGGPPMALVYQRERAAQIRSTLAGFFLFGASLAIVSLTVSGQFGRGELVDGVRLLPGLLLGVVASRKLGRYLDNGWTRPALLALCTVAAIVLIVDAVV